MNQASTSTYRPTRRDFLAVAGGMTVSLPLWLMRAAPALAVPSAPPARAQAAGYFESAFGLTGHDHRRFLTAALSGGGDYADLFYQHGVSTVIVMEDDNVNRALTSVSLGVGVRVLKGERTGYAFTQVLEPASILEAARSAALLASAGGMAPGSRGVEVGSLADRPGLDLYPMEIPWSGVDTDKRLELIRRVGGGMSGADPAVKKTLLHLQDSTTHLLVVTSEGVERADLRPRTGLFASAVAERNGRKESNYTDLTARAGLEIFTPEVLDGLAQTALRRTLELFEARPVAAGEMPVVLAAGSAGILLHEAIGHGLEADFNRRGISTYSGRMGEMVAPAEVTVVDDGTIPHSHGAINFDDEGADSRRTVLVEKGRLVSYLHDRLSARWFKTESTGSGRRQSFQHAPLPRMRATFMENGPHKPEEVIASVKKGIWAEQFSNGQVNIGAGDFSFYVKSGRAIENGRLTHPVKDINVVGNGPEALGRIAMVADDLKLAQSGYMCGKGGQSVPVSQGLPTTLVSKLNVGGNGNRE